VQKSVNSQSRRGTPCNSGTSAWYETVYRLSVWTDRESGITIERKLVENNLHLVFDIPQLSFIVQGE
jgi:hypothetical protein